MPKNHLIDWMNSRRSRPLNMIESGPVMICSQVCFVSLLVAAGCGTEESGESSGSLRLNLELAGAQIDEVSYAITGNDILPITDTIDTSPLVIGDSAPLATEGLVTYLDASSQRAFDTSPDGTALLALGVPPGIDFEISAVTDEPAGGSGQPTTQPFLVGSWGAVD